MSMITRSAAAAARAAGVRQLADRPSQRRSAEHGSSTRAPFRAAVQLRAKGDDESVLQFDGLAAATEQGYEMWDWYGPYTEIVSAGAFANTLARSGLDVPLVLGHDQLRRIARTTNGTLTLEETDEGLRVLADLDRAQPHRHQPGGLTRWQSRLDRTRQWPLRHWRAAEARARCRP